MNNEKAIEAKLESYCEWCVAQGGHCHAKLDGCSVFEVLALLAEKPCGWISADEPPEDYNQVWICYEKTGYTYNAYYSPINKTWNIFNYSGGFNGAEDLPTHWMPIVLPEPDKPKCKVCKDTKKVQIG